MNLFKKKKNNNNNNNIKKISKTTMATSWHHIPVHSVSEDDILEDPFDESLETTFPPLRYMPLFYDRQAPNTNSVTHSVGMRRRESSRERDRLYQELVGHAPYKPLIRAGHHMETSRNDNKFRIQLDVKHYRPDEVTLKVDGMHCILFDVGSDTELRFCSSSLRFNI